MNAEWMLTLAPVAGLAANVFAQIACARILRRLGLSIVAGALCGLLVTALCTALDSTSAGIALAADWAVAILTYFAYWAFLNLNITSLRIRILREILQSSGGVSRDELTARYSADEFLRRRLERLETGRQMSCRDGRWRLESRTLLVLARTMEALRALVLPASAR